MADILRLDMASSVLMLRESVYTAVVSAVLICLYGMGVYTHTCISIHQCGCVVVYVGEYLQA